mgnify:CR=1 FL=1
MGLTLPTRLAIFSMIFAATLASFPRYLDCLVLPFSLPSFFSLGRDHPCAMAIADVSGLEQLVLELWGSYSFGRP